jgi:hypothetical protein
MRDNQVFECYRTVCLKYPLRQGVQEDWCHAARLQSDVITRESG